jgi:putative transposase
MDEESILFKDKYRIPGTRLPGRDYARSGRYYVTICTKGKYPWFGDIQNGKMYLSDFGRIVDDEWKRTALIRPYVELNEYVVMPNHFHGIIILKHRVETPCHGVSTTRNPHHHPEWKPGCLGAIIHQFKRACTVRIREMNDDFAWQPRFHDSVIREGGVDAVRNYIINNPAKWESDEFF